MSINASGIRDIARVLDERVIEAISIIENGFNGVKEENPVSVLEWINRKS